MTMTDHSVFLSRNFLEFVVSGNSLLQESIRTLTEELKEKIGIKLPQELKLYQDTEIELKQKLGLKLFQDVEQAVEDEFQNRKEHSWSDSDIQRGVNFSKTTDLKTLQICKATALVYLGDLRLKKDLFLKEQVLAPVSVRNAVEARVNEVTKQIKETLGDVELDEIWKEAIRYHFRDHFQSVKDVLATLDQPTHATPFFAPPEINEPAQMSATLSSEEGYQLYQPQTASKPPQRPQAAQVLMLPPLVKKLGADSLAMLLAAKVPILVGLTCFVGTVGFLALNPSKQNSTPTARQPEEFVDPSNNSTVIESSTMPSGALDSTTPTAAETASVVAIAQKPIETSSSVETTQKPLVQTVSPKVSSVETIQKPLVQTASPKVSSRVISESAPDTHPLHSHRSKHRSHSRHHKSRHGRHHSRK
jgi:hypothetical protein